MTADKPLPRAARNAETHAEAAPPSAWLNQVPSAAAQRDLKYEAILTCAAVWFHKHGYHGTSLADIAGDLGVTKAALYHYAKNKEELLYQLHVRSLVAAKAARDAAMEVEGNALSRLERLIHNVVLLMTGSVTDTFFLLEPGTLNQDHTTEITQARAWLTHDLRDLIRAGVADGSMIDCDPKLVVYIIVGAQNWIGRWYRPGGEWTPEEVATRFARLMRRMLDASPSAA